MYFPDLSQYSYLEHSPFSLKEKPRPLNVGWLDIKHTFPTDKASKDLLDALFEACSHPVNKMRGFHQCLFCRSHVWAVEVSRGDRTIILGSAEIRVKGKDGKVYAAPDLIFHYVAEHHYKPPTEFVEALLSQS